METRLVISTAPVKYGHVSSLGVRASLFIFITTSFASFFTLLLRLCFCYPLVVMRRDGSWWRRRREGETWPPFIDVNLTILLECSQTPPVNFVRFLSLQVQLIFINLFIYSFIISCTSIAFVLGHVLLFLTKNLRDKKKLKQIVMRIIQRTRSPAQRGGHKVNDRKDHWPFDTLPCVIVSEMSRLSVINYWSACRGCFDRTNYTRKKITCSVFSYIPVFLNTFCILT